MIFILRTFKILAICLAVLGVFRSTPEGIPRVISPALAAEEKSKPGTSAAALVEKLKAAREKAAARRAGAALEQAAEEEEGGDAAGKGKASGAEMIAKLKAARERAAAMKESAADTGKTKAPGKEGKRKLTAAGIKAKLKLALAKKKKSSASAHSAVAGGTPSSLFGTKEVKSTNLKPFPKWTGVLDRYFSEVKLKDEPCTSTKFNKCHLAEWKKFLGTLEEKGKTEQIKAVNDYINKAKYIVDPKNYQIPDYWATPGQFFDKDGDCEDYAIAKFMSLRALGFTNEEMRIVVLQDQNLKIPHSILVVYRDGIQLVLDNQIPQVIPDAAIVHYKPIYSMNENSWWLHKH